MDPSSPQRTDSPQLQPRDKDGRPIGMSPSWQSFASMSSNQLPSQAILESMDPSIDAAHESEHDRPSVLPEILPGFKSRMADIHHATLKSVADSSNDQHSNDNGNDTSYPRDDDGHNDTKIEKKRNKEPKWTGGTMFPTMMGYSSPFGSSGGLDNRSHNNKAYHRSTFEDANRKLARNSILYESSDLTESTTKLSDEDDNFDYNQAPQRVSSGEAQPSRTLVQGGQGDRRWSHELSPDKAGLVGAALEAAGLLKDVVLDKIHQRPPSSSSPSSHPDVHETARRQMGLSPEEKLEAAKVAFGGAEEAGDQNIYLEGLQEHLRHENAARSAAAAAEAAASLSTGAVEAKDLLGSAPEVAQEHRKSVFHLAANPEVRKSMLLEHPESLGYHARDPNLAPFEEPTVIQHRLQGSNVEQDLSKTSR
ncbi:hypothetical protein EDD21DRAFT_387647 [Dissophora ornata]|nr:hypothetical protein EDD21DRAFT_387647 [Dissophora ornata]